MDTKDLIIQLKGVADALRDDDLRERVGIVAINTILACSKIRIFEEGRDTSGEKIGNYSTKPIYVTPVLGLPRITPRGKSGSRTKKNGDAYKTRFYPGGYREFRDDVGRQNAFVDLNLTSSMFGAYRGGFNLKGQPAIGFINEFEARKMSGNESRFKKEIAPPTIVERQKGIDAAAREILVIIEERLK